MFVYSLAGLQVEGGPIEEVELEDNETTARTGVYQLLARLLSAPDAETQAIASRGEWSAQLRDAGTLLAYPFEFGEAPADVSATPADFQADFLRVFEVGNGQGPPAPIYGGLYGGNRMARLEDVVRFYEYFGLTTSPEDPRPADHLATELEFMKYLTFKEAVSSSPRLQTSYRRAQHDFLDRQLLPWVPDFARRAKAADAPPFWRWASCTVSAFIAADARYVAEALME